VWAAPARRDDPREEKDLRHQPPDRPLRQPVIRHYYTGCYVEGDVDLIYGDATAVFDGCEIRSLNRGSSSDNGYITAASTWSTNPRGFLFTASRFTSDARATPSRSAAPGMRATSRTPTARW
jgi:pectin methylesterase-like acyl-CoA thioesterase